MRFAQARIFLKELKYKLAVKRMLLANSYANARKNSQKSATSLSSDCCFVADICHSQANTATIPNITKNVCSRWLNFRSRRAAGAPAVAAATWERRLPGGIVTGQ